MAIENEELMRQLQRIAGLSRRGRHAHMKHRPEGAPGEHGHEGRKHCGCRHHHHGHGPDTPGGPEAMHGHGGHRCHGGSGRHGQNRVLAALMMQDGTSQKDLAYLLGIRPQSLSEALAKLEESGMIERRHNEEDRRVVNVYLTDAGRDRALKAAEDRKRSAADIFSVLTEEEKDQLSAILGKLSGKLEEELGEGEAGLEDGRPE